MRHLVLVSLFLSATAFARGLPGEGLTKQARPGDPASQYQLRADGSFFRQIGSQICQVAAEVDDFKIAQHPADASVVYFVKRGALHALPVPRAAASCPKAEAFVVAPSLRWVAGEWGYRLVSSPRSRIVALALDEESTLHALGPDRVEVLVPGIADFAVNPCFGQAGKSFSSYVAFAIAHSGHVVKIGGKDPAASKPDTSRSYRDLGDFTRSNRVCR